MVQTQQRRKLARYGSLASLGGPGGLRSRIWTKLIGWRDNIRKMAGDPVKSSQSLLDLNFQSLAAQELNMKQMELDSATAKLDELKRELEKRRADSSPAKTMSSELTPPQNFTPTLSPSLTRRSSSSNVLPVPVTSSLQSNWPRSQDSSLSSPSSLTVNSSNTIPTLSISTSPNMTRRPLPPESMSAPPRTSWGRPSSPRIQYYDRPVPSSSTSRLSSASYDYGTIPMSPVPEGPPSMPLYSERAPPPRPSPSYESQQGFAPPRYSDDISSLRRRPPQRSWNESDLDMVYEKKAPQDRAERSSLGGVPVVKAWRESSLDPPPMKSKGDTSFTLPRGYKFSSMDRVPPGMDRVPAGMVDRIPQGMDRVSQGMDRVSQGMDRIPQGMDRVPQGMDRVPQGMDRVPQGMDRVPQGMDRIPQGMDRVPQGMDRIPQGMDRVPQGMDRIPQGMDRVPQGMDRIPQGMDRVPQGMDRIPQGMDRVPQGMDRIPQGMDRVPQGMDRIPAGMDRFPQGMDHRIPQGMDRVPAGMMDRVPQGMDRIPHGMDRIPQGMDRILPGPDWKSGTGSLPRSLPPQQPISRIPVPPPGGRGQPHRPLPLSMIFQLQNAFWQHNQIPPQNYAPPPSPMSIPAAPPPSIPVIPELPSPSAAVPVPPPAIEEVPRPLSPTRLQPLLPDSYADVQRVLEDIPRPLRRRGSQEHTSQGPPLPTDRRQYRQIMNRLFGRATPKSSAPEQPKAEENPQGSSVREIPIQEELVVEEPNFFKLVPIPEEPRPEEKPEATLPKPEEQPVTIILEASESRVGASAVVPGEGEQGVPLVITQSQTPELRSALKGRTSPRKSNPRRARLDPLILLLDGALTGELDVVNQALQEVNDPSQPNEEGITALHNAICGANYHIVNLLISSGANVNAADSHGWTPLHCAASCNDLQICSMLVRHGAAIFATTYSDGSLAVDKCDPYREGYKECLTYLTEVEQCMGETQSGVVYALWDYTAEFADELSVREGDSVTVLRKDGEGGTWWWAALCGREGYIPRNYFGMYPRIRPQRSTL